ncbi:GAF domain-containing protein [Planctobacterium marinum]|uniref:GAF domain-containing protein n=1 Tax=Planctobacterium marinum TaxID=1631968 RepID=UPI001E410404|nr:GAF domain-containing protein [Planctobacterium marinum]MCC2606825.1 GAF domain-containing protein [Planctobacterium marinum]
MDHLFKLNTVLTNPNLSQQEKLHCVCAVTQALVPGADRVSLWLFDNNQTQITSLICFDALQQQYSSGTVLTRQDFGSYFDAILDREIVNAPDAALDPVTSCFAESYFRPLNIQSLLDYVLHRDFEPRGIICCESVARTVDWTKEDEVTLRKIARACSFFFNLCEKSL